VRRDGRSRDRAAKCSAAAFFKAAVPPTGGIFGVARIQRILGGGDDVRRRGEIGLAHRQRDDVAPFGAQRRWRGRSSRWFATGDARKGALGGFMAANGWDQPRKALPIRKPSARSSSVRSASTARPSSISERRSTPGSRPSRARRGQQRAVAFDKEVGEAAFGEQAVIAQEQRLVAPAAFGSSQRRLVKAAVGGLVAQPPVARIDTAGQHRAGTGRQGAGRGRQFERSGPAARQQPAAALGGASSIEAQRLDGVAHGVAIESKAQLRRAGLDPFEMQFEQRDPLRG
jgi:hypothetical protein